MTFPWAERLAKTSRVGVMFIVEAWAYASRARASQDGMAPPNTVHNRHCAVSVQAGRMRRTRGLAPVSPREACGASQPTAPNVPLRLFRGHLDRVIAHSTLPIVVPNLDEIFPRTQSTGDFCVVVEAAVIVLGD